jgi:NitT/TauT family transport system substrate-binding protein
MKIQVAIRFCAKQGASLSLVLLLFLLAITSMGCSDKTKTLKIAEQYGIAYAPLQVMKENQLLEKALGDEYQVEWVKLANTAAIREAMLGDDLDIGFIGIPPFLIGVDTGMDWKMISGLSESPLALVVNDPSIRNLSDLIGEGKIALPQPGSIQHILLAMAAKKQLGDAKAFDLQLISMKHPDGVLALNAGKEVLGHYTSPPYLFQELENPDNHVLVDGIEATGEAFTFIVGVCREEMYEDQKVYEIFEDALKESIELVNLRDPDTMEELAKDYELDVDVLISYLDQEGMAYNQDIKGTQSFIDFMYSEAYLSKELVEKDLIWNR